MSSKNVVKHTYPSNGKGGPVVNNKLVSQSKDMPKGTAETSSSAREGSHLVHKSITGKGIPKNFRK